MSDATIVALAILGGVFLLMALTILKSGIEAAIKMWGVMGALTGVAFGAITSYYFTNEAKKQEVAAISADKARIETLLTSATQNASRAQDLVLPIYSALRGDPEVASTLPARYGFVSALSKEDKAKLLTNFAETNTILKNIQSLDKPISAVLPVAIAPAEPAQSKPINAIR